MSIAVIMPTRGVSFARVEQAIEEMRNDTWMKIKVYRSYDLPIPDCQNELVEQALQDKNVSHLFFIEEDTVPPMDALKHLFYCSEPISFIDYSVAGWTCSAHDEKGEVLWCGLGCTMVKRCVFETMEKPYFRSDKQLRLNDWTWVEAHGDIYGGQDIWFCTQARKLGFKIKQVEGECEHLQLEKLGTRETNNGFHIISQKPMIEKYQIIHS